MQLPGLARIVITVLILGSVGGDSTTLAESRGSAYERWSVLQQKQAWAEGERLLLAQLRDHPEEEWLYINLAWALREQGKFDEAIAIGREAYARFPDSRAPGDSLSLSYIKLGEAEAARENYGAALPYYEAAYKLRPETDYIILHYAIALANLERYEDSLGIFRAGVRNHPGYEHLSRNLVWTLVRFAQSLRESAPERALALALEAYRTDSDHRGALQIYGEMLIDQGDAQAALPVLRKGHDAFPGSRAFCWPLSLAYRLRVEQLHGQGRASDALHVAREIPSRLRGEARCDNSLLIAIDKSFAMIGAFEEGMPLLEDLAARHPRLSTYAERAGFHVNRYAVRLRTTGHGERAKKMRERANALLRRAMNVYEANHPDRPKLTQPVRFPLEGPTLVVASFDSGGTHSGYGKYCYDLISTNEQGATVRPGKSGDANEHFYGFGAPVHAVRAGTVDVAHDGDPDPAPNAVQYETDGNFVRIQHGDGSFAWYVHLKNASVKVEIGQRVRAGDTIAALGNSGMSVSPHLHFCIITDDYVSLDFRFEPLNFQSTIDARPERTDAALRSGWIVSRVANGL